MTKELNEEIQTELNKLSEAFQTETRRFSSRLRSETEDEYYDRLAIRHDEDKRTESGF